MRGLLFFTSLLSSSLSLGAACLSHEKVILPKFMKAKTIVSGTPTLIKISQAKNSIPEHCISSTNEVGWQNLTYSFAPKTPLKISVYSSGVGSLLWKTERVFPLTQVVLQKKQGDKDIYNLEIIDPKTKVHYEFQINLESSDFRLRAKP